MLQEAKQTAGCSELAGHTLSSAQSRGKEKGHVLLESFRERSRACDKLLMELCFASLAKGQMSRGLQLPEATEPTPEASMEIWQHGAQQQQEPHVLWAPALCLHTRPALPAQQSPMGSHFPMATLAPTQTSPLLHSPTALAFLPSPQSHSGALPSLLSLRSRGICQEVCDTHRVLLLRKLIENSQPLDQE